MRRSILIADDEAANREVLREAFEKRGYGVRLARDGWEAVEICRSTPVTLGIFDVRMPRLSGIDAIRELRLTRCEIPILITTSERGDDVRRLALESGANGFFLKPVDLLGLREMVRGLIGEETALAIRSTAAISITVVHKTDLTKR
jgi:CheY-like chemotaxis protein